MFPVASEAISERLIVTGDREQGRSKMAFPKECRAFHHKAAPFVGVFLAGRLEFIGGCLARCEVG